MIDCNWPFNQPGPQYPSPRRPATDGGNTKMGFIVITRVKFSPAFEQEVTALGAESLPIAKRQPGLQGFRFHRSHAGDETLMYWHWDSREAHEACMASPDWGDLAQRWDTLFASGEVEFSLDTYEVVEGWGM